MTFPVMLLHGFASSFQHGWQRHGWPELLEEAGRTVIAYDLPGHGERRQAAPAEFLGIASQLVALLEGKGPLDIVGFSAGARVAMSVACLRPNLIRRLVLIGASDHFLEVADNANLIAALQSEQPPENPLHAILHRLARAPANSIDGLVAFLHHAHEPLTPHMLARISAPVLVLSGSRDARGDAPQLRAALPHCAYEEIHGCDHFSVCADPRTLDCVLNFLGV